MLIEPLKHLNQGKHQEKKANSQTMLIGFPGQQILLIHLCQEFYLQVGSTSSPPAADARCIVAVCHGTLHGIYSERRQKNQMIARSLNNQC